MLNDCYFQIKPLDGILEISQLPSRYSHDTVTYKYFLKDKKEISIGRDKACDIKLCWDKTYSKYQTLILWDDFLEQWKIIDGGHNGSSRNGTWIIASKSQLIKNETIIRIANTKVEATIIYNNELERNKSIEGEF
jgi:hypothetical protein